FTQATIRGAWATVTPWWFSVRPLCPDELGLEDILRRVQSSGASSGSAPSPSPSTFSPQRAQNPIGGSGIGAGAAGGAGARTIPLVRVDLRSAIYGFFGQCPAQGIDEEADDRVDVSGALQLWIPNLPQSSIELLSSP
ncbi:MAG TPA: hypothetical protein VHB77_23165, partial [Planctomycetaceae bacterium]|nr:hypothetical protein [Planctomycetaceae bacterium]